MSETQFPAKMTNKHMEEQINSVTQQKHTQELQNLHSSSLSPGLYSQINI